MKKIDLHIHTVCTNSDPTFEFDINVLSEYVRSKQLDAIAITNHNTFNLSQYQMICRHLPEITVFPGIEINVGKHSVGHLLLISENNDLVKFDHQCKMVETILTDKHMFFTVDQLKEIFGDLSNYLLIPHYTKKPHLDRNIVEELREFLDCGEVASIKDFVYCAKNKNQLTPVYFSDFRTRKYFNEEYPFRQTYLDIESISLSSIKFALKDKNKVQLSKNEGNHIVQILDNLRISTGLNVILGERASGKTFTVDAIAQNLDNVKYIKQFELLEREPERAAKEFESNLTNRRSDIAKEYLKEFESVVDEIVDISIDDGEAQIDKYIKSLKKFAFEQERADVFSKCKLFSESLFQDSDSTIGNVKKLIDAVQLILDNNEFKHIIDKNIERNGLVNLLMDLVKSYRKLYMEKKQLQICNELINNIQKALELKSASTKITDINFYNFAMNREKVKRFEKLVYLIKSPRVIMKSDVAGFKLEVKCEPYQGAGEMRSHSKTRAAFSAAFGKYDKPYEFLQELTSISDLARSQYHEFFVDIKYRILNCYGFPVSGGERAEFLLLQKIDDASRYDMLIIDEPESSFDNLFLKNKVNSMIKDISQNTPVIIVTHNSTVGASIHPDYVIHTKRVITSNSTVEYRVYFGRPSDKYLLSCSGEKISNIDIMMDCLEAGEAAYNERRSGYDLLKDK